jgi:O-antigen/teichoic acid export membrane protein
MSTRDNKRIAKNTLMLYIRMFITMGISLFTTRIILEALGVTDYGIYNAIGGIVVMFGILSKTLAASTLRFLNFSMGGETLDETRKTFSMSLIIHGLLALFILLIGETIGLWFLMNKMSIPSERMHAAQWVYQFSIFAGIISVLQIPYTASIIANEKMKIYAYVSIVEAVLKLGVGYILLVSTLDLLILYGVLVLISQAVIFVFYCMICKSSFDECRFYRVWDKQLFVRMLSYSGWNTISGLAGVFSDGGINIILNIFFGPAVNAARAISMQVNNAVRGFASNFQIAVNPQIVKLYASGKRKEMFDLIISNAQYSFFLVCLMAIPFVLEMNFILHLWLSTKIPEHTSLFCRIILLQTIFLSIHIPLGMGIHAQGKMKIPNLSASVVYVLVLPTSYVLLKLGFPDYTPFLIMLLVEPITITIDLILLKRFMDFPVKDYLIMFIKSTLIVLAACIIPALIQFNMSFGWFQFIIVLLSSFLCLAFVVYRWGLSNQIKEQMILKFSSILK